MDCVSDAMYGMMVVCELLKMIVVFYLWYDDGFSYGMFMC